MRCVQIQKGLHDLSDAIFIRTEVFIKEQGFCNEFDEIDQNAYHAIVYYNEKPVATGRMFPTDTSEDTYIIGRIAVLKEYRRQHIGAYIIEELEKNAKNMGAITIELSAQVQAKPFYERLGYTSYGKIYLDETCPHVRMKKEL